MFPPHVRFELEVPDGRRFQLNPGSAPIPPGVVHEASEVLFHLEAPELDVFGPQLEVEGIPLERVAIAPRHLQWRWAIGFHAGAAEVVLRGLTPQPLRFDLVTDPDVAKLTRECFTRMVGDILSDTLSLITLTGHRTGIARGKRALAWARFEYLRRCFDRLERSILEINAHPWARLQRKIRRVPPGGAGGATALELAKSLRKTVGLTWRQLQQLPSAGRALANRLGGRLPREVQRITGRFDHRLREHANILQMLSAWGSFLSGVHAALESPEPGFNLGRLNVLMRRVRQMERRLGRLARLPLFDGLSVSRGPIPPSHVFRRVPPYRRLFRAWRDFLTGLADISGSFSELPIQRTFDLYELWAFLRFAHAAALYSGSEASWRESFVERDAFGGLVLRPQGKPLRFGDFELSFQPLFRETWKPQNPRIGSFSRQMQPDIALSSLSNAGGEPVPVVVLDAKYRVDGSLAEAVASIHTYCDALVHDGDASKLPRKVVHAAFLLTPQQPGHDQPASWQDDNAPEVFLREGYHERYRFGAISLKPGITVEQCRRLLLKLLASCNT